jgi:formylglycine-generating enzyme required for sulfatase activity
MDLSLPALLKQFNVPIILGLVAGVVAIVVRAVNRRNRARLEHIGHYRRYDIQQARKHFIPVHLQARPDMTGCTVPYPAVRYQDLLRKMASERAEFPEIVLVLSATGMGKTTLLLKLILRHQHLLRRWYEVLFSGAEGKYQVMNYQLSSSQSLADIRKLNDTPGSKRTILLLDGLDEIMGAGRLSFLQTFDHVRAITGNFRGVVITCRGQYAGAEQLLQAGNTEFQAIMDLADPQVRKPIKDTRQVGAFTIRPFTADDIRGYLDRLFPWYTFRFRSRERADALLLTPNSVTEHLGIPLVLAYLKDIIADPQFATNRFSTHAVLRNILDRWMQREAGRINSPERPAFLEGLRTFSEDLGFELVQRDRQFYTVAELAASPAAKSYFEQLNTRLGSSSLLTRILPEGRHGPEQWGFVHRTFRDFFAAACAKRMWDKGPRVAALERDFFHAPMATLLLHELCAFNPPPAMAMAPVEGGSFTFGPSEKEKRFMLDDPRVEAVEFQKPFWLGHPSEVVILPAFHLGKATVTVRDYRRFVQETDFRPAYGCGSTATSYVHTTDAYNDKVLIPGMDFTWGPDPQRRALRADADGPEEDHPVVNVPLRHALAYCNWLSRCAGLRECYTVTDDTAHWDRTANGYRLPTPAEWQFAAKGGVHQQDFLFAGADEPNAVANTGMRHRNDPQRFIQPQEAFALGCYTMPVRCFLPNRLGVFDMSGNVSQWTWGIGLFASYVARPEERTSITLKEYQGSPEETSEQPSDAAMETDPEWFVACGSDYGARRVTCSFMYPIIRSNASNEIGFRVVRNGDTA